MARLTGAVLPDAEATSWNREVFHADTAGPEAIVTAGWALPLLGERRLVLVRGLADASAKIVDRLRSAIARARAEPAGWPGEATTVLFVAVGADRRGPVFRLVPDADQVEVRAPASGAVTGWLRERARAGGIDLASSAAQALVELVGDDLSRLASELEKAALHAGSDRRVSEEVVRALAGQSRVRHYWELTQALEEGKRSDALRLLESLLVGGDEPMVILAWLAGYLREIWRVLPPAVAGEDPRQVARLLPRRRPDWAVRRLMERAKALGTEGLAAAVARCFDVERRLKSSGGSPRALLTALVADLAAR